MRGRRSDGTMSETAKPTDPSPDRRRRRGRRLSRAGAQIPPGQLRRPDRPGRHGAHHLERIRERPHPAGLDPHRRARRRQDHDRAHPRARAQLRIARRLDHPADHRHADDGRALPGDHREPPHRRLGDGRRLAQFASRTCARSTTPSVMRRCRRATRSTSSTKCTCSRAPPSTRC